MRWNQKPSSLPATLPDTVVIVYIRNLSHRRHEESTLRLGGHCTPEGENQSPSPYQLHVAFIAGRIKPDQ